MEPQAAGAWARGPGHRSGHVDQATAKVPATACSSPSLAGPDRASYAKTAHVAATDGRTHTWRTGPTDRLAAGPLNVGADATNPTQGESSHAREST